MQPLVGRRKSAGGAPELPLDEEDDVNWPLRRLVLPDPAAPLGPVCEGWLNVYTIGCIARLWDQLRETL